MILDERALLAAIEDSVRKVFREELGQKAVPEEEYVSVAKAAERIEVAPATVRAWIGQGKLHRYQAGRELRVKLSELDAMLLSDAVRCGRTRELSPEEQADAYLKRRAGTRKGRQGECIQPPERPTSEGKRRRHG